MEILMILLIGPKKAIIKPRSAAIIANIMRMVEIMITAIAVKGYGYCGIPAELIPRMPIIPIPNP